MFYIFTAFAITWFLFGSGIFCLLHDRFPAHEVRGATPRFFPSNCASSRVLIVDFITKFSLFFLGEGGQDIDFTCGIFSIVFFVCVATVFTILPHFLHRFLLGVPFFFLSSAYFGFPAPLRDARTKVLFCHVFFLSTRFGEPPLGFSRLIAPESGDFCS